MSRLSPEELRRWLNRPAPKATEQAWRGAPDVCRVVPDPTGQFGYVVQQSAVPGDLDGPSDYAVRWDAYDAMRNRAKAAEAARDALADELANLRAIFDHEVQAATLVEREACARVVVESATQLSLESGYMRALMTSLTNRLVMAIRARGLTNGSPVNGTTAHHHGGECDETCDGWRND